MKFHVHLNLQEVYDKLHLPFAADTTMIQHYDARKHSYEKSQIFAVCNKNTHKSYTVEIER